jgi:nucleoside-diphosphate-sugar epimerase
MNCGITGHTGALGQEFVKKNDHLNFIKFKGNLIKRKEVENWVKKNDFDFFFHFAAIVPTKFVEENYLFTKKINIDGTKNLINALSKFHKKRLKWFFFSSTSHVYDFKKTKIKEKDNILPISKYGKTKLLAENILIKKKLNICIGRIFSFTHKSHDKNYLIPSLYNRICKSKKKQVILENLNHYRDFLDISDICSAISLLMKKKKVGVFNICSSKKNNLKKIALYMAKKKNISCKFKSNKYKITSLVGDNKKLSNLGWRPKKNINYIINSYIKNINR